MKDIEHRLLPDDAPEADVIEQRLVVDADGEPGLDTSQLDTLRDRHVDEADVIDQATVVPALEEMIETLRSTSAVRLH
ncbi:hypothetical protein ACOJVU_11240 [Mycobacterium sp. THU-M104]|uniref:hypothetical protein n=1 Tax=Mycobacterium sp. THU-M104 TaxID=3410515 RepID=UPI003B9D809A